MHVARTEPSSIPDGTSPDDIAAVESSKAKLCFFFSIFL